MATQHSMSPDRRPNPRLTFGTFVETQCSLFARRAAEQLAELAPSNWNPFLVIGGIGCGKTHLLHAIANRLMERKPSIRVIIATAEEFMNEAIQSMRHGRMPEFRARWRALDVVLLDDLQVLNSNKKQTLGELLLTIGEILPKGCLLVLAAQVDYPAQLDLPENLLSKLLGGLVVDIKPPEEEDLVTILRHKFPPLPASVETLLASQAKSARELEGFARQVTERAGLTGVEVDYEFAYYVLRQILPKRKLDPTEVIREVARLHRPYNVNESKIRSGDRHRHVVQARHVTMWVLSKVVRLPDAEIARVLNMHHSTVAYGVRKVEERREANRALDRQLDMLGKKFNSPAPPKPGEVVPIHRRQTHARQEGDFRRLNFRKVIPKLS